ncbi:Cytochrome C' [compost metagenome]
MKAAIDNLQSEVQKLQAAARASDENGVKSSAVAVGRACNGCHEDFSTMNFRFKL